LNLRAGSSTKHKVIRTIPKGKTVNVSATASNGWYKVSYAGKTGWISNKYTKVAASTAPKQPATKGTSTVKLWVTASANVNIRKGSSTGHASVGTLPKN
ncbi:SH3 domain-containing protein, partial [Escherichia coli]|nr:SH3 domain-containing protein [Escherichia coli]